MGIKINEHHIYKNPEFETEKKILEGLTKICNFSTEIGVLDYFPKSYEVRIGLIDEEVEGKEEKVPIFKSGAETGIFLGSNWNRNNPITKLRDLPLKFCLDTLGPLLSKDKITEDMLPMKSLRGLNLEFCIKVLGPLLMHWEESAALMISVLDGELKEICENSFKNWKEEFYSK